MDDQPTEVPEGRAVSVRSARWLDLIARLTGRGGARSERVERLLLGFAAVVFVVATVWAWQQLPEGRRSFDAGWMGAAVALGFMSLAVNGLEFRVSAWILARRTPVVEALRVSVLGSAANVLPLPGAAVIRTRALLQLGEGARAALSVTVAVGMAWVSAAAYLAALVVLVDARGRLVVGLVFLVGALAGTAGVFGLIRLARKRPTPPQVTVLFVVEFLSVLVSGVRLYLIARAIGFEISVADAITVNLGGVLASAAGFFPGALGIRELASGLFAGLAGIASSIGVLMSVVDRLAMYIVLAMTAIPLLRRQDVDDRGLRAEAQ